LDIKEIKDYKPSFVFRSNHLNTIFPSFFRKIDDVNYERSRIITEDNDFIDLDWSKVNSKKLVVILHGLEGCANRHYVKGMCRIFNRNNWDALAMNYRGCSGEMNKTLRFYHGGATDDLDFLINYIEKDYEEIVLVGFSLGANLILKYLGDGQFKLNHKLKAAAVISAPCDLKDTMVSLQKKGNIIYSSMFLKDLKEKVKLKKEDFPNDISPEDIKNIKSLKDFDDKFTAPVHGFKDAYDYYEKCSCKKFLKNIKIPTLIINALDDPFLSEKSYPVEEAALNENLVLLMPKYGGHVGFSSLHEEDYWTEKTVFKFINSFEEIKQL